MAIKSRSQSDVRTRRAILDLLKQQGPQDAAALAEQLAVSDMAVRQHLYALRDEKLITYHEQPRPVGRPAKMWELTTAANDCFPDCHADLTVGLIGAAREAFGEKGVEKLLNVRIQQQTETYQARLAKARSLRAKLNALAKVRTEEGYMAEVHKEQDGSLLFVENHCPICTAATTCVGLCGAEMAVFQAVLGDDVQITRTEHILDGARRCAYRVTSTDN